MSISLPTLMTAVTLASPGGKQHLIRSMHQQFRTAYQRGGPGVEAISRRYENELFSEILRADTEDEALMTLIGTLHSRWHDGSGHYVPRSVLDRVWGTEENQLLGAYFNRHFHGAPVHDPCIGRSSSRGEIYGHWDCWHNGCFAPSDTIIIARWVPGIRPDLDGNCWLATGQGDDALSRWPGRRCPHPACHGDAQW